jgi:NAD(P)-dependent dehydrogenase (short-subunit alcohol dehydrogenase family)
MTKPTGRLAVVTGAARGLGLETCRQLAALGHKVVLTARTQDTVDAGLKALGLAPAQGHTLDVGDERSVEAFFAWLAGSHGHADILVNNAGRTFGKWGDGIAAVPAARMLEAIDNNALGAWRTIRAALPAMNRAGYGRIVNVSSGMGQLTDMNGGSAAYRISKTAMNAVTRIAAAEAKGNVKINSVCPGWVRTDMGGQSAPRDVATGAAGIVWAATLPDNGPSGGFFRDRQAIAW